MVFECQELHINTLLKMSKKKKNKKDKGRNKYAQFSKVQGGIELSRK